MIKQRLYKPSFENTTVGTEYTPVPPKPPTLIRCPCCGGEAVYKSLHAIWVECTVCGLSTPAYTDIDTLSKVWNGGAQIATTESAGMGTAEVADIDFSESVRRDGLYYGVLTKKELDEAIALKKSREIGEPILVKPRKHRRQNRGRPPKAEGQLAPKYVPTGRPPGRPRKYPKEDDTEN